MHANTNALIINVKDKTTLTVISSISINAKNAFKYSAI